MNIQSSIVQSGSVGTPAIGLEALVAQGLVSPEALDRARLVQRETGERLDSVLTRLGLVTEQALAEALASATGLPLISTDDYPQQPIAGPELSFAFLQDNRCIPVAELDNRVRAATANPFEPFIASALAFMFGKPVDLCVGRPSDIDQAIDRLYRGGVAEPESDGEAEVGGDDLERLKDLVSDAPVIRAVNRLIAQAVDGRASDIHIEPAEDSLRVRFRIDGVLQDRPTLPAAMRAPLISRIKIIAGLDIAEKRLPQDGRLRIAVRGHEVDLRVATAPSIHGESVVMRILDKSKLALDLGVIGLDAELTQSLRRATSAPHGIVLVTGPTGSGKTTTLYAALAELNQRDRKLLTVEDPIEYRLPGVVQAQVNPAIGFTFGAALRSFLRQDPDVIMVGEIRDGETAEIAVQAALTGHMILSTLHTNTAAGAVTRLLDMDVEPFLLSSVLTAVVAQRLVRRLCEQCRRPHPPPPEIARLFEAHAVPVPALLHSPAGCRRCNEAGYIGRVAVFELLSVDEPVARLILGRADTRAINDQAVAGGMRSLVCDGLIKAAAGTTSVEEVLRVASGGE